MISLLERLTGMHTLTDQVIAMDFMNTVKSGIRNYAMAVTEAATPEVQSTLASQLEEMLDLHERIAEYATEQGLYHPWNVNEQIDVDLKNIEVALKAPNL
ncbi:spore coat protein [Paenibacillus sp.]|uniref:spore coat protein n=1 Tax=Paenibacillus sp. TaxID=58172 RepID=UPI002D6512F5|nr:spore coat protein [Paenibacillus sp.]HZG57071.1 spore coat protein [Paenibacillus sp.]